MYMDNRIDLNAVAIFVRIVETGSLSAAARLLQIPKTTVSKRLADLEESLGVALITRTTRNLRVTDAGKTYFEHSQAAVRRLEQGRVEMSSVREHPSGLLKITAAADIAHTVLAKVIDAFVVRYPGVRVELIVTNRLVDLLGEGIDLAVRAGAMRSSGLVGRRFIDLTSNVYGSSEYLRRFKTPLQPQDLPSVDYIAFSQMQHFDMVRGRSAVKINVRPRVTVDDLETVRELLMLGTGIGWLPDFLALVDAGKLVPAVPEWHARIAGQVHFLYANPKHPSVNVRTFVALALELLPTILHRSSSR
jgi:DNA-binding transcriptional LysR family regulator